MPQVKFIKALQTSPNNKHFKGKSFEVDDVVEVSVPVADSLELSRHVMVLKMDKPKPTESEPTESEPKPKTTKRKTKSKTAK